MFAPLVDYFTGRSSAWKAKYEAAFVTLVDPTTGVPYTASGGSGGSGFADILYTDNSGTVFVYRDTGSGTMSAFTVPGGAAYTVGASPRPYVGALETGSNIIGRTGSDLTTYGTTNSVFVGGTSQVSVTPTVTAASAYTTGNVVGGLLTFANVVQGTVLSGVLQSVTLTIRSTQTATFKLYIFRTTPSTTFTDKTAPAITTTDAANLVDVVSLTTPDTGLGSSVTLYAADNIGRSIVLASTSLFGVLTVTGTPTFTTTGDVTVTASVLKD